MGPWYNGKTPRLQRGDASSILAGSTNYQSKFISLFWRRKMKNGKELNGLIIGIGRIAFMMGQLIFVIGVVSCWLGTGLLFSIYLMCVGIGVVVLLSQRFGSIYIIKIIRRYRGKSRKAPSEKEEG